MCVGCSIWTAVLVALSGLSCLGLFVVSWAEGGLSSLEGVLSVVLHSLGRCVAVAENCNVCVHSGIQGFPDKVLCCFHC